jgi:hypothetical protein
MLSCRGERPATSASADRIARQNRSRKRRLLRVSRIADAEDVEPNAAAAGSKQVRLARNAAAARTRWTWRRCTKARGKRRERVSAGRTSRTQESGCFEELQIRTIKRVDDRPPWKSSVSNVSQPELAAAVTTKASQYEMSCASLSNLARNASSRFRRMPRNVHQGASSATGCPLSSTRASDLTQ